MSDSRLFVLDQIARVERICDLLEDASRRERTALVGQMIGTIHAIGHELKRYGISYENEEFGEFFFSLNNNPSWSDVVRGGHAAAAYLRGLVQQIP